MEIEVYLYASLSRYLPEGAEGKSVDISVPPGSTPADIVSYLHIPEKEVKLVFVNGARKDLDTRLAEGDRVGFFPPVGGG